MPWPVAPPAVGHGEVPPLLEPELELPLEPLPEPEPPDEPLELELPSKAPQKVEVPPLLASHRHVHGPVPLTADAVPAEQRSPAGGALVRLWALAGPHMPLTAVPPLELDPEVEPEEPVSPDELLPDELEPELEESVLPDELPLELPPELEAASDAKQFAVVPSPQLVVAQRVLMPVQLHVHGPLPLTADAVPEEQRLPVGVLVRLWPLDGPHMPSLPLLEPELDPVEEPEELVLPDELPLELELASKAPQKAALPPLLASHRQVHGPAPLTADAVPAEQRLPVGALATLWPLDGPHMPLTTTITPPPEPEPEELEPPDETLPDELEPELEELTSPDELLPDEFEPEPEELASPDELLPDELEPELEPPPEPGSGRTQRELPLSHRRAATCVSLLCRLRLLTGIVPLRVTTDYTPLVSV